jgi:GDP-4-dehydro-6-deoxy-D-mannose reductase
MILPSNNSLLAPYSLPLTYRYLITGINGFVGQHLAKNLLEKGHEVYGVDIQERCFVFGCTYFQANICNNELIAEIVHKVNPSAIFHLAAVASPSGFHSTPFSSFQINIMGTISIFDAMRTQCSTATLLSIGSSTEYKTSDLHNSLPETGLLEPTSFYGVSKYTTEIIGQYYVRHHNLDIRFTRSFNHTGPGQGSDFVCSDWAKQVAAIEIKGATPEITVGNIDAAIDFSDVRDVVEAYAVIVEKGQKGEVYNVCSRNKINLNYILEYLIKKSKADITVSLKSNKVAAPNSTAEIIGDNSKICKQLGWSPKIPFEKTLDDLYDWWVLQTLGKGAP